MIDADQVSREIVSPGEPALDEIARSFGAHLLLPDGTLDRKALGALVMGDSAVAREERKKLERITHPRIFRRIGEQLQAHAAAATPIAAVEAAIMVESGNHKSYSALLVVACDSAVQLKRLMDRQGFDAETAAAWVATQMPIAEKVALADAVVHNNGSREDLELEVSRAWAKIERKLAT